MRDLILRLLQAILLGLVLTAHVMAQDTSSDDDVIIEEDTGSDEDTADLGRLQVTGSRLAGGDPTARVYTITAGDIAAQGLSSVEDIVRSIPFNFSSINGQTNMRVDGTDQNLGALGLGISTANLRGLGSAATLVLVNGRRVAGSAGQEDGFVNIANVPASAIERVEIQIDGASAVYGSDAVGGVINFILYKDYSGGEAQVRYENSS